MNVFQIIGLTLAGLFCALLLRALLARRIGFRAGLAWLALWVTAGVLIAWPELTAHIARLLGISRGADLVFYCAVLAGFVAFFSVYAKLRRIEGSITLLVRQLALHEAETASPALRGEGGNAETPGPEPAP